VVKTTFPIYRSQKLQIENRSGSLLKLFAIYDSLFTRKAFMEKQTVTTQTIEKQAIEKQTYAIGDRVEKLCAVCQEERGHVVASITKRGLISRVTCPKCGTRGSFSNGAKLTKGRSKSVNSEPYDRTRTYRAGQTMSHPIWGPGEVTALIEPRKIDVLFADRIRRLIHSRADA
jgi:hypothetical protein